MEQFPKPSGISLPLLLKKRWEYERQYQPAVGESATSGLNDDNNEGDNETSSLRSTEDATRSSSEPLLKLSRDGPPLTKAETEQLANRVFTAKELEERIWMTTNAMVDIQRQLYRGEEVYYEDTHNHGNIYRGWDAFVDAKDVGGSNAASSSIGQPTSRRVPADSRWFSSSCRSISRMNRPTPLSRQGSTQDSVSRPSSNPTPVPLSSGRSDVTTPSPAGQLSTSSATWTQKAVPMDIETSTPLAGTAPPQEVSSRGTPMDYQPGLDSENNPTVVLSTPTDTMRLLRETATSTLSLLPIATASRPNETTSAPGRLTSESIQDVAATSLKSYNRDESIDLASVNQTKTASAEGGGDNVLKAEMKDDSLSAGTDAASIPATTPTNNTTNSKKKRKERDSTAEGEPPAKKSSIAPSPTRVGSPTKLQSKDASLESADTIKGGKSAGSLVATKEKDLNSSLASSAVPTPMPKKRGRPSTKSIATAKESASTDVPTPVASVSTNPAAGSKTELAKGEKKDAASSKAESSTNEKSETPRRGRPRRSAK